MSTSNAAFSTPTAVPSANLANNLNKTYASAVATPSVTVIPLTTSGANARTLADRICSMADVSKTNTNQNTNNNGNNRSKSHRKLPRAGTSNNAKLPRAASASNGLPRRRSFHGQGRPLTPTAQAARDGYYARKAAKMYAERRKTAAAAAAAEANGGAESAQSTPAKDSDSKGVGVINVTVDSSGVKIGNVRSPSVRGISRQNSRSKMTRSSSRQRNSFYRGDEKENAGDVRPHEADIDAYFSRKRSENSRKPKDRGLETQSSWDGSMPRRQGSKSFIERAAATNSGEKKSCDVQPQKLTGDASSPNEGRKETNSQDLTRSCFEKTNNGLTNREETNIVNDGKKVTETSPTTEKKDGTISPAISNISENGTEADQKLSVPEQHDKCAIVHAKDSDSQASNISAPSKTMSETSNTTNSSDSRQMPLNGKWCKDCAGLGLEIAALIAETSSNSEASPSSSSGSSKKGWKSMVTQTVLGDSKSKTSVEKNRLSQEVKVLKSTVEFLYKKIEVLEKEQKEECSSISDL